MEEIAADPAPVTELPVDRISDLPEPLLLAILSLLPTHRAVQTSLLSRRFRNLWTASPSLYFNRAAFGVTAWFVTMVDQALRGRDRSVPLERVRIESRYDSRCLLLPDCVLRWFYSVGLLGVRDLRLRLETETVVLFCSVIFAIASLESLRISTWNFKGQLHALLPVNIKCKRLKSLHLWINMSSADLTRLVGGLPVLEDLELGEIDQDTVDISSVSVKRLTLHCKASRMKLCFPNLEFVELLCRLGSLKEFRGTMPLVSEAKLLLDSPVEESVPVFASMLRSVADVVRLCLSIEAKNGPLKSYLRCCDMRVALPRLEHLNFSCYTGYLSTFQVEMPSLRKAEIRLSSAREEFVPPISGFLKCIENVVDLKLHVGDHWAQLKPFHILESSKEPPIFPHLVSIGISTSCHQATIEDVISLLEKSPVLKCLQIRHQDPYISSFCTQDKKKVHWQSKLPRNSEGNYRHARFTDLHHGDEKSRVIKLLLRRLTSKKRKRIETGSTED